MPITAKLFDGTLLRFPDDTPQDVIDNTARRETLSRQAPAPQQQKGPTVLSDDDNSSDMFRTFGNLPGSLQETWGGMKALTGIAATKLGAEETGKNLLKSGMESMEAGQAKQTVKATDEFTYAWDKGIGTVLTDYLPAMIGSGLGSALETAGFMAVGTLAGAVTGSTAGGVGAVPGAAVGATAGFLGKQLIKKGVKEAAEELIKKETAKGIAEGLTSYEAKQLARDAGAKFIAERGIAELTEVAAKEAAKRGAKSYGATAGITAQAGLHGTGEVTGRAIEEAEKRGEKPEDIELTRVLPAALVHSIADFISSKILVGAFQVGDKSSGNVIKDILKSVATAGVKEIPAEELQAIAERAGAKLSLTDAEAFKEYLNTAAASVGMMAGPGTVGGIRTRLSAPAKTTEAQTTAGQTTIGGETYTPTNQPSTDSPIVSTQTINVDGTTKEIVKVFRRDGSIDIDGVQVKAPDAETKTEAEVVPPIETEAKVEPTTNVVETEEDTTLNVPTTKVETAPVNIQATPTFEPTDSTELKVIDAYAQYGSTDKVAKVLGIDKNVVKSIQTKYNIPSGGTAQGRVELDTWKQNRLEHIQSRTSQGTPNATETTETQQVKTPTEEKPAATSTDVAPALYQASYDNLPKAENATHTFKTEKGSVYEHRADGTTVRDKQQRPEHPGENEKGLQPASTKTLYINSKDAGKLTKPSGSSAYLAPVSKNTVAWHFGEDYGPRKKGEVVAGTETEFTTTPQVGLTPIEVFQRGSGQSIHYGNPIVELQEKKNAGTTTVSGAGAESTGVSVSQKPPTGGATTISNVEGLGGTRKPAKKSNVGKKVSSTPLINKMEEGQQLEEDILDVAQATLIANQTKDENEYNAAVDYLVDTANRLSKTAKNESEETLAKKSLAYLNLSPKEIQKSKDRINAILSKYSARGLRDLQRKLRELNAKQADLETDYGLAVDEENNVGITESLNQLKLVNENLKDIKKSLSNYKKQLKKYNPSVMLRRGMEEGVENPIPRDLLETIVDRFKDVWKGLPKIRIVDSVNELEVRLVQFLSENDALGAPGLFDADTGDVILIRNNMPSNAKEAVVTIVHEVVGHYGLRTFLGDKYSAVMRNAYLNPTIKKYADEYRIEADEKNTVGKKIKLETAIEEGIAYAAEVEGGILSYKQKLSVYERSTLNRMLDKVVSEIRAALRKVFKNLEFSDTELRNLLVSSHNIVANKNASSASVNIDNIAEVVMSPSKKPAQTTIQAPPHEEVDLNKVGDANYKLSNKEAPTKASFFKSGSVPIETWRKAATAFQNWNYPIRSWENTYALSEKIYRVGQDKINNIYEQITLSISGAKEYYIKYIALPAEELDRSVSDFAKAAGIDVDGALEVLHKVSEALHEPERRMVKFILNVPLKNPAADRRAEIVKELRTNTKMSKKEAQTLRDELDSLVFEKDAKGDIKVDADGKPVNSSNVDAAGFSPSGNKSIDIYGTLGNDYKVTFLTLSEVRKITKQYEKHANKKEIDRVLAAVQELHEATAELNKLGNYWSQPVTNIKNFYGWKNYVPLKGISKVREATEVSKADELLNFDSPAMGRELQDADYSFDGRISVSDNPILRTMTDATLAAGRAGRKDLTLAIKNAINQGILKGTVSKPILFEDRNTTDLSKYKGEMTIFHHNPDGSIEILKVENPNLRGAIRKTYKKSIPIFDLANSITGKFGMLHTRYNYQFAPLNFVRDALTNAFTIGADMGVAEAANFIKAISVQVVAQNGLYKAMQVAVRYNNPSKRAELTELAKNNAYIKSLVEYIEEFGMVTHLSGLSLKSNYEQLHKDVGRSGIARGAEAANKIVDMWTDMFELASRGAAYGIVKQNILTRDKSKYDNAKDAEKAARVEAAAYVKNLANFEQVGHLGKALGGLYMFFRPSATGAVRAIEAAAPAFTSVETAVERLPPDLKKDPVALAAFKKNYAEKRKNAQVMCSSLVGLGMVVYAMSSMMSDDDDLGRNATATDDMQRWTRFARFHIPRSITQAMGIEKPVTLQIPWGFGLGAFAAAGAQLAAVVNGPAKLTDALANIFLQISLDSFIPIPVSRMPPLEMPLEFAIDSITPSVARPIVEFVINKNGLGQAIYNDRNRKFGDAYTGGDNIPSMYKDAARYMVNEGILSVGPLGNIDVAPNTLYFLANSYADGIAKIGEGLYGIKDHVQDDKSFDPKKDIPLMGSFFGTRANIDAREFSRVSKEIEDIKAKMNMFKTDPTIYSRYRIEHPFHEIIVDRYNHDINGTYRDLVVEGKKLRLDQKLSPKTRESLLRLNEYQKNLIKRNMLTMYKLYGIEP
jgi:hypothetical protein